MMTLTAGSGLTGWFGPAVNFHHFGVVCDAVGPGVVGCHHVVLLMVVLVVEGFHQGVVLAVVVAGGVGGVDVRKLH